VSSRLLFAFSLCSDTAYCSATQLLSAAARGRFALIEECLDYVDVAQLRIESSGNTLMHQAVQYARVDVVTMLLDKFSGRAAELKNNFDETPMSLAFSLGKFAIIELFQRSGVVLEDSNTPMTEKVRYLTTDWDGPQVSFHPIVSLQPPTSEVPSGLDFWDIPLIEANVLHKRKSTSAISAINTVVGKQVELTLNGRELLEQLGEIDVLVSSPLLLGRLVHVFRHLCQDLIGQNCIQRSINTIELDIRSFNGSAPCATLENGTLRDVIYVTEREVMAEEIQSVKEKIESQLGIYDKRAINFSELLPEAAQGAVFDLLSRKTLKRLCVTSKLLKLMIERYLQNNPKRSWK
jgi:hypothetical protein